MNSINIKLLEVIEKQLLEVVGILTLAENKSDVIYGQQRLVGIIHGLRIVMGPHQEKPMTIGELELKRFDHAKEMSECQTTPAISTS